MSRNTLVIPDLHGKVEVMEWALEQKDYNVIFLGDYLDSFDRTRKEQLHILDTVLKEAEEDSGRITALMGNHEMSYLSIEMRCSGFSKKMWGKLRSRSGKMQEILQPFTKSGGFLISHAGVSQKLLEATEQSVHEYLGKGKFGDIGRARGGWAPCGGLFWCDWWAEFEPVDNVPQIVGHSAARPVLYTDDKYIVQKYDSEGRPSYNVDCLDQKGKKRILVLEGSRKTSVLKVKL